ncbi:MAG: peptide deformylase [Alphaproteobacteria bacterium]|nr:peptide deformylase [Alphaproteobacteria bacterium]
MVADFNSDLITPLGYAGRIVRAGHPVLHRVASEVTDISAAEAQILAKFMTAHMAEADGVGLAAPQIGVGLRAIVFWVPRSRFSAEELQNPAADQADSEAVYTLFNPRFAPLGEEMEAGIEGCLSIPGLCGMVSRYRAIRYGGYDLDGNWREKEAFGFHARVVQHEIDHLDGILYPEKMTDLRSLVYNEELIAAREAAV